MDNDTIAVVYAGVTGTVVYASSGEAPTPDSLLFTPDGEGWACAATWVEPWQVQSATPDDGGGSAGVHELLPVGAA